MTDRAESAVPANPTSEHDQSSRLGPPLLIKGEDGAAYQEVLARISRAVKPKDFLEEIWVRDVTDLTWEILRMRRLKSALLASAMSNTLPQILAPALDYMEARDLSRQWALGHRQAVKQVSKLLSRMGLTSDALVAEALVAKIGTVERIDQMLTNAEVRRNAALREIERHRKTLGLALQQVSDNVVEAEFEDLAPDRPAQRGVA